MSDDHACFAGANVRRGSGFTLIELLIVIAIIAVLVTMVGVVAPVIQNKINATKCQRNLKTIHQVVMGYAEQNDGWLPDFGYLTIQNGCQWPGTSRPTLGMWAAMSNVEQMKALGASAEVFFCPLDPRYGNYDDWAFDSWNHPHREWNSWSSYWFYETNMGYITTINKGDAMYNRPLTDGRPVIRKAQGGTDDMPIFADVVRLKTASATGPYGWYHGGDSDDVEDRAYQGGGNTLFFGGYVMWKEWVELDLQATSKENGGMGLGCGRTDTSGNSYYLWLGHETEE